MIPALKILKNGVWCDNEPSYILKNGVWNNIDEIYSSNGLGWIKASEKHNFYQYGNLWDETNHQDISYAFGIGLGNKFRLFTKPYLNNPFANYQLWGSGLNENGQLGLGHFDYVSYPVLIDSGTWTDPICGYNSTLIIQRRTLDLYGCGNGIHLGLNSTENFSNLTLINDTLAWARIAVNNGNPTHSLFLTHENELYGTGHNTYGQLGSGVGPECLTLSKLNTRSWSAISCGENFSVGISNYDLYTSGLNDKGQLGLGDNTNRSNFTLIPTDYRWIIICAGPNFFIAIDMDEGYLWGCGDNSYGQLGLGDKVNRNSLTLINDSIMWASIICGYGYMIAMDVNGSLWGAGRNDYGQLGLPSSEDITTLTKIGDGYDNPHISCFNDLTNILN